jgi:hypothetical protein
MIGIPMEAGDGLFFTENLRHGGLPNLLDRPRKTIHLQIGPTWAGSQSPVHWNKGVHVSAASWLRYSEEQRALFPRSSGDGTSGRLLEEVASLQSENKRLRQQLDGSRQQLDGLTAAR